MVSNRTGSTSSKEAYAFFYRPRLLAVVSQHGWDGDPSFPERCPFSVAWDTGGLQFETIVMHVSPGRVVEELAALGAAASVRLAKQKHLVVMGDLNADCAYLTKTEWKCIRGEATARCDASMQTQLWDPANYHWLIGDEADTTTKDTDCAYDRQ